MFEGLKNPDRRRIALPAFDADHALSDRRQTHARIEARGDARLQSQPHQPSTRKNDGIHSGIGQWIRGHASAGARVELAQARVDIPAQSLNPQIRPQRADLRLAAQTGSATTAPSGKSSRRLIPDAVTKASRGSARSSTAAIDKPFGSSAGTSFIECTSNVGAQFLDGDFEFLYEEALAADGRERAILNAIALRDQRHELDVDFRMSRAQQRGHMFGLPKCQLTLAGRDA